LRNVRNFHILIKKKKIIKKKKNGYLISFSSRPGSLFFPNGQVFLILSGLGVKMGVGQMAGLKKLDILLYLSLNN
jgi:hypothetical protein